MRTIAVVGKGHQGSGSGTGHGCRNTAAKMVLNQGTRCARSRGGGAIGGRLCVQWLSQGSVLAVVVAQSRLGTMRGSCR